MRNERLQHGGGCGEASSHQGQLLFGKAILADTNEGVGVYKETQVPQLNDTHGPSLDPGIPGNQALSEFLHIEIFVL